MQIVINISKKLYDRYKEKDHIKRCDIDEFEKALDRGVILPKGHGNLFDETEILRFLRCPKYENCDWKNCSDCNQSRCINLNNVNRLVPIIKADKDI